MMENKFFKRIHYGTFATPQIAYFRKGFMKVKEMVSM